MDDAGSQSRKTRSRREALCGYRSRGPHLVRLRSQQRPCVARGISLQVLLAPTRLCSRVDLSTSRFHPAVQRVKEIVDSGELGKIKSMHSELAVPYLRGSIILKDDVRYDYGLGGGATMDMGGTSDSRSLVHDPSSR